MWHPGSTFDGHLMILTSDNALRIYNVDLEQDGFKGMSPEEVILLSGNTPPGAGSASRFFGESSLTVRGSLGETAVSFTFAPPVACSVDDEDNTPYLWPVFILFGDGSVYFVVTGLGQYRPEKPVVMGPLSMLPESEDNYGIDACAITCLHPMISSPPILVIATSQGTLYHCIVLQKIDPDISGDAVETASQISDWSVSVAFEKAPVDLALHVYESIELELALVVVAE